MRQNQESNRKEVGSYGFTHRTNFVYLTLLTARDLVEKG